MRRARLLGATVDRSALAAMRRRHAIGEWRTPDPGRPRATPTTAWVLLLLFCKSGRIKPSAYHAIGKAYAVKKAVERLGVTMRAAFGLDAHPIHAYSKIDRLWQARFLVDPSGAASEDEAMNGPRPTAKKRARRSSTRR